SRGNPGCQRHGAGTRLVHDRPPVATGERGENDMADDRRPFLDLGGIDGEPPHSPHRNDIGIHLMSGAGTARAGRWDQDAEHAVAADPDSASVLRAEYGSAGADELDFGAGAGADVADEDGG